MSNTFAALRTSQFTSQHAFPQSPENRDAFSAALADVAASAAGLGMDASMIVLVDYLAGRVEAHSPELRAILAGVMADTDANLDTLDVRLAAIESEAARTAVMAMGVNVARIAPVDFPTLTRAWVIARNNLGHRPA